MALIILGGIGFPVFAECAARWKNRTFRLSAYAKLVVGMTAGLVFGGALLLLLFGLERRSAATILCGRRYGTRSS